jgi:hypothetical protein
MAKAKAVSQTEEQQDAQESAPGPAVFVLNKSFGAVVAGVHKLWAAGSEFVAGEDDATISLLARSGADLTQK